MLLFSHAALGLLPGYCRVCMSLPVRVFLSMAMMEELSFGMCCVRNSVKVGENCGCVSGVLFGNLCMLENMWGVMC